jgi:hypothetical protein
LIGGPNQSHKVNFKEPSPRGKISIKNFGGYSVNTFPGYFRENLRKDPNFKSIVSSHCQLRLAAHETTGGGTCDTVILIQVIFGLIYQ